jgi:hypothetical protein
MGIGNIFKAIAGIALVWYAPQLAIMATGAMGVGASALAFYATTAAITLVGASISGSALAPSMGDMFGSDSYAGQKLKTTKDNYSPVSIVYGENRLAGNIIWQTTNSAVNNDNSANGYNRDYWSIIALTGHTIEDVLKIYANDKTLDVSGTYSDRYANEYTHLQWHNANTVREPINDIEFVKDNTYANDAFTTITGYSVGEANLTLSTGDTSANRDNLLDDDDATYWLTSNSNGLGEYVSIDMGATAYASSMELTLAHNVDTGREVGTSWTIQYSDNNTTWTNANSGDDYSFSKDEIITINVDHAETHRYWRIQFDALWEVLDNGNLSSKQLRIYSFKINTNINSVIEVPKDVAYLAVHQVFDAQDNKNTEFDNLTVELKGKKIRVLASATTYYTNPIYSNNPAEIILDLLRDTLSIADADIDYSSIWDAKQICEDNEWTCNLAVVQQANIQSVIQDVLGTFRGQIVHSGTQWKLKVNSKETAIDDILDDDDFISNSLSVSMRGNTEIANKIIFKYINPQDNWLSAQVMVEDTDLQTWDGQTIEKILDVKGVTNTAQAKELTQIALNTMRYSEGLHTGGSFVIGKIYAIKTAGTTDFTLIGSADNNVGTVFTATGAGTGDGTALYRLKQTPLALSFATTVKNAHLEVGDVITIQSDLLDRDREFVILSVETDQSGLVQISTREYCETHFRNTDGNYVI